MTKKYINEVSKDYDKCILLDSILSKLFVVSVIISIILHFAKNDILCVGLIVIHIIYILIDLINDVIDSNNKNKEQRISVVYDEENTNDVDKIKDIINSISNSTTEEFDITLGYDSNGFINKITIEKMDITVDDFNDQFFIHKSSSQLGASVKSTLDAVLDSNRKYENHKITVIIDGINSADSDAITNVKNSIDDFTKYNVNYSYDQAGYINQITFQR